MASPLVNARHTAAGGAAMSVSDAPRSVASAGYNFVRWFAAAAAPYLAPKIEGWTDDESRGLLDTLYRHASKPDFCTRFAWQDGSLAFWDNRATWHYAVNDYQGERRLMHRITIEGCALVA